MSLRAMVEETIGGQWTGAVLHNDGIPAGTRIHREMRVCEAVARSFDETIVLAAQQVCCLGACRSLGLADCDAPLAQRISTEAGIELETVYQAVNDTPRLAAPVKAITLGRQGPFDVLLGYVRPEMVMKLVRRWQEVYGAGPEVKLSSFMALCGNVLVGAHKTHQLCLSFGCPDSRRYGGLREDMIAVGLPFCRVSELFRKGG